MTTTKITLPVSAFNKGALPKTKYESVIEFYNKATVDYAYWSKGFNMHYGYLNRWYEIFMRERMLENMNRRVFDKLELAEQAERVVDMGCGVGATCRALIRNGVSENAVGVNIVNTSKWGTGSTARKKWRRTFACYWPTTITFPFPTNVPMG